MKKLLRYSMGCWMALTAAAVLPACDDDEAAVQVPAYVYPSKMEVKLSPELEQYVYLDETGTPVLPMMKGTSASLDFEIRPDTVTYRDVKWTSSDESVATVDADGTVTAVSGDGRGYAVIQVAPVPLYAGSGIYGTLKVAVANTLVEAEEVSIEAAGAKVYAGEQLQLTATVSPANATYRTVKWTSSNEEVATIDAKGVVTGKKYAQNHVPVTFTATTLDGSRVSTKVKIMIDQVVAPEQVTIDAAYDVESGYRCAINEKTLKLAFTTVPEDCTLSQLAWSSSDESIATVEGGVVTFNQDGTFGDVTISATCPTTGASSATTLRLDAGLVRELFRNEQNVTWRDAKQSGNNTSTATEWHDGYVTVTTYKQNDTAQRAGFKCQSAKTWLHAGNYPIFAIRMDDVADLYKSKGCTARNITLDAVGKAGDTDFKGGLDGNNNKWLHDYKCSDGSHVFIYDLSTQKWATGGVLPTTSVATFTAMQFKYADMKTLTEQVTYNVYWVQTFRTIEDLQQYIEGEGLTYEVIK